MQRMGGSVAIILTILCLGALVALAEVNTYNGRLYERVGCALGTARECATAGGRVIDSEGIWLGGVLHWRDIGEGEASSSSPGSSTTIAVSKTIRETILPRWTPGPKDAALAGTRLFADMFYNRWERGTTEGATLGANPTVIFGGQAMELTFRLPLHLTRLEGGAINMYHIGADVALRLLFGDYVALGAHGAFIYEWVDETEFDTGTYEVTGGPFVSLIIPLGAAQLGLACLYEYTLPQDAEAGDQIQVVVPAANLGIRLSETLGINGYGIYYMHLEEALTDYNYYDVGGDLRLAMGETWTVSLGAKATLGLDSYSSMEAFLGSEWRF